MASHILEPIDKYHDKNAWIFQYDDTAHVESGNGETFNQVSDFENTTKRSKTNRSFALLWCKMSLFLEGMGPMKMLLPLHLV